MNIREWFALSESIVENEYSLPSPQRMNWMKHLCKTMSSDRKRCFLFLEKKDTDILLDVYFFEKNNYKHFLITPSYRMTYKEKTEFDQICREENIITDNRTFRKVYAHFCIIYGNTYVKQCDHHLQLLHNIYYVMHRGYVEELFYKSRLENIGFYLTEIQEYNMIGDSPSEVLELPIKVLRVMNSKQGISVIDSDKKRKLLLELYHRYITLFTNTWTIPQCLYFVRNICEEHEYEISSEDKVIMEFLGCRFCESDYYEFVCYQEKRLFLEGLVNIENDIRLNPDAAFFDARTLYAKVSLLFHILAENHGYFNYCLKEQNEKHKYLEFQDEEYSITLPQNMEDIYWESYFQHNCLHRYMLSVADGNTCILLLRKKHQSNRSFVTVEIVDECIIYQALGKYNQPISMEVYQWLENYANSKGLVLMLDE